MKPEETEAETVFSAHAEVVPRTLVLMFCLVSILRARGGSSIEYLDNEIQEMYSPRTRR